MKFRVESTETGEYFNIRQEASFDKIKLQVNLFTKIPPQDQILLVGPPYKILDSQYGPNFKLDGKRVFVFNRRIIADETMVHNRMRLLPFEVSKPQFIEDTLASGAPISTLVTSPSPSSQYLLEFEKYFLEQLKRGQCYETFIQEVFNNCRAAVAQHQVQLDGIDAAIWNLRDTYNAVRKPYEQLEARLSAQQQTHRSLLDHFEEKISQLAQTPIHPALVTAIERSSRSGESKSSSQQGGPTDQPVTIRTLYDCIPIERERAYYRQCEDSFYKVEEQLVRARTLHAAIAQGVADLAPPAVDFARLSQLMELLNAEVAGESATIAEMRRNYRFVYDTVTAASTVEALQTQHELDQEHHHSGTAAGLQQFSKGEVSGTGTPNSNNVNDSSSVNSLSGASQQLQQSATDEPLDLEMLVSDMAKRKFNQERQHHLSSLERRVVVVKAAKQEVEDSQNALIAAIYSTLRRVARFQTDIQYKLKKDVEWMRKWTAGHNEYFRHLEHISSLGDAYQHLLHEVVRRKAYNGVFESEVSTASDRIAKLRSGEIKERELFMASYGLCLPPVFFRAIPTLKDKPPYFNPNVTEEQWLPDVHYDDLDTTHLLGASGARGDDYVYSNQQQHEQLSRLNNPVSQVSVAEDAESRPDTPAGNYATQAAIDDLLRGGAEIRSNAASAMGEESSSQFSAVHRSLVPATPPPTGNPRGFNAEGGSVILPAVSARRTESYEELLQKYNRQTYENSRLLSTVEDLRRQLSESQRSNRRLRTQSGDVPHPVAAETVTDTPALVDTVKTRAVSQDSGEAKADSTAEAATTAIAASSEDEATAKEVAPLHLAAAGAETYAEVTMHSVISESEQQLVSQLMEGYLAIRQLLVSDPSTSAYLANLASHSYISSHRDSVADLPVYRSDRHFSVPHSNISSAVAVSGSVGPAVKDVVLLCSSVQQAMAHVLQYPLISFMDFRVGDIALFMPQQAENRKIWIAFNSSYPYRFLSDASVDSFQASSKSKENRKYILGRIVLIDRHTAEDKANPFALPPGTVYFVCHCERIVNKQLGGGVTSPSWASSATAKMGNTATASGGGNSKLVT